MNPENLYATLSPEAHAALIDGVRRQAERERRDAIRACGLVALGWLRHVLKRSVPVNGYPMSVAD
jgi:hypothetical protein